MNYLLLAVAAAFGLGFGIAVSRTLETLVSRWRRE
jgi:hypothetical protein